MATELQDGNNVIKKKRLRRRKKKEEKWEIDERDCLTYQTQFMLEIKREYNANVYWLSAPGEYELMKKIENEEWLIDEATVDETFLPKLFIQTQYKSKKIMKTSPMMFSEWMLNVPEDLTENWIMVPCPIGKRIRLFSCSGITRATTKTGDKCALFPSALPGGNCVSDNNLRYEYAIVDCIWVKSRKVYYLLDVLYWRSMPFTLCEAEFRRYWVNSQLNEMEELQERGTRTNKFPILPLPNIPCDSNMNSALASLDTDLFPLDGLLFYHRHEKYTYGYSPFVTWLKPFMLSEVFKISVPPEFQRKPDGYINIENYVTQRRNYKEKDRNLCEIEEHV